MENLSVLVKNFPAGMDAALITSSVNRRYYTGFPSSAGTIVVTPEQSYLIIDSRYYEAASKKVTSCQVILQDKLYPQVEELLAKHNAKKVGIETATLTVSEYLSMKNALENRELIFDNQLSDTIINQRMIKTSWELEQIQKAQDVTDLTFTHILGYIQPGMSEIEVSLEMEFFSRKNGSEGNAFSYIIAAGKNSSMPHAVPSENKIQKGDFLTMDFGCMVNGYRSDMTRTIAVGEPSSKQKEVYELVLKAQLDSMATIKAGIPCKSVDQVARDIIDSSSYKGLFGHGLGHGVGLDIHEDPRFSQACDTITQENMVMSVEPGIYISNEFGVRIEDIVAIQADGYHNFAHSKKELIVL